MITENLNPDVALFASPYDFRTSLSETVNETDTRSAIESGDWGFVHSFTTGSAVDGPGVRIVGWLTGCTMIWSALFTVGNFLYGRTGYAFALLAVFAVSAAILIRVVQRLWR